MYGEIRGMGNDAAEGEETDILIRTRSRSVKNVADAKLERTSLSADVFQGSSVRTSVSSLSWVIGIN